MYETQTWGEAIALSMIEMWSRFIVFFPVLLGAFLVMLIGWIISSATGKLAERIMQSFQIDKAFKKAGLGGKLLKNGKYFSLANFFGSLIKWFLILVFLMAASDILELSQVTEFLDDILMYIPNVIVAVVILSLVFLLGNFVHELVKGSARVAGVMSATILAEVSKWAIIVFGIFAALIQLGVAESLVNTMFMGIVAMLSLAGGLAFGLGGREEAALILKKIREKLAEK